MDDIDDEMKSSRTGLRKWLCLRNIIDFPPLWTVVVIVIAVVLSRYTVPLTLGLPMIVSLCLGVMLCVFAFGMMIWCAYTLVSSNTPALPHNKAEVLVTHGPYQWSRNPIYLADIILLISFTFLYQSLWPLMLVPVLFLVLQRRFVLPEEAMLQETFPEAFMSWEKNTRRWI